MPLLSKSQANVIESPGSSSREPALQNWTGQRRLPFVGVALMTARGRCGPFVYSHRYMPASAFGGEEAVAVGEQVEVPVGPELQVHRVVALERERRDDERLHRS